MRTGINARRRWLVVCIQIEGGVPGDEYIVDREGVERLVRLKLAHACSAATNLREAIRDEEDEVDEHAVCRALDLEVAEERVGPKEVECFVNNICSIWIRLEYIRDSSTAVHWIDRTS